MSSFLFAAVLLLSGLVWAATNDTDVCVLTFEEQLDLTVCRFNTTDTTTPIFSKVCACSVGDDEFWDTYFDYVICKSDTQLLETKSDICGNTTNDNNCSWDIVGAVYLALIDYIAELNPECIILDEANNAFLFNFDCTCQLNATGTYWQLYYQYYYCLDGTTSSTSFKEAFCSVYSNVTDSSISTTTSRSIVGFSSVPYNNSSGIGQADV
ncbi:uncharacterized protein ASCRUDRAFT_76763, partial [Ascoidea rubescens DSM 1968]